MGLFLVASAQAGSLEGTVRGLDGKLVSGAEVRIQRQDGKGDAIVQKTDSNGKYEAKKMALGTYVVTVTADNGARSSLRDLKMANDNPRKLDFELKPTAEKKKVKQYVWMPPPTGSHMGGKWVEVGSANEADVNRIEKTSGAALQKIQARGSAPKD